MRKKSDLLSFADRKPRFMVSVWWIPKWHMDERSRQRIRELSSVVTDWSKAKREAKMQENSHDSRLGKFRNRIIHMIVVLSICEMPIFMYFCLKPRFWIFQSYLRADLITLWTYKSIQHPKWMDPKLYIWNDPPLFIITLLLTSAICL